jgi:hypothetical protein
MYQYIQKRQFDKAFAAACQGVTEHDWSQLAQNALQAFELPIATRSFQRLNQLPFMHLLDRFRRGHSPHSDMISESARVSLLGDVSAMQGQLSQAARLYVQAGHLDKAVGMYSDLRLFDAAQELLRSSGAQTDHGSLAAQRARWQSQLHSQFDSQPRMAAESALQAGQWNRALPLMRQLDAVDLLLVAARRIDPAQHPSAARQCAQLLLQHGQREPAAELLEKLGDYRQLAEVHTSNRDWPKAFRLLRQHPSIRQAILLPYAEYLAENGQFVRAQQGLLSLRPLSIRRELTNCLLISVQHSIRLVRSSWRCVSCNDSLATRLLSNGFWTRHITVGFCRLSVWSWLPVGNDSRRRTNVTTTYAASIACNPKHHCTLPTLQCSARCSNRSRRSQVIRCSIEPSSHCTNRWLVNGCRPASVVLGCSFPCVVTVFSSARSVSPDCCTSSCTLFTCRPN